MKFEHEEELEQTLEIEYKRTEVEEPVNKEEEILDLFGEPIAPKTVKLPPAKSTPKPASKPKPTASPKSKEEKKYGPEFQYAYAGHVGNLPEEDMTLERVREYLQVDFPELSKERTRIEVDEDKNLIIPIVKGTKSG